MAEKPSVIYGRNFARLRERAGLRQHQVADLLGYAKSSNANVSSIEVGRRALPRPAQGRRHAKLLNAEPWELLEGVETEYDRLRSGAPSDKNVKAAPGTSEQSRDDTARAQVLLRRWENEQARVAATREQLGQKVGEISNYVVAQLGDLAAIVSRLPGRQAAVARGRGPGSPRNRKRRRRRDDQKRPPETPQD